MKGDFTAFQKTTLLRIIMQTIVSKAFAIEVSGPKDKGPMGPPEKLT
jgi:hypothetical protein